MAQQLVETDEKKEEDLWTAAREGHLSSFFGQGKSISKTINNLNKEGHSLLYVAARNGHLGVVQWLVVNGADMDLQCKYSQSTPLHAAAFYGHASVVRYIVTAECRKDIVNKYGSTAAKEAKTDEIRRCIERPTRAGAGRFTVKKEEVPAFDLDYDKSSYSKMPFKDEEWRWKSFENRFKMVMQFKKMGVGYK